MTSIQRRYPKDEFARKGDELYERQVRPQLGEHDHDKFVALDIDTGEYELDEDELTAGDRLRQRLPQAQIWYVRVGSDYLHRFGHQRAGKK
jgi:hypothetical protein